MGGLAGGVVGCTGWEEGVCHGEVDGGGVGDFEVEGEERFWDGWLDWVSAGFDGVVCFLLLTEETALVV